MDTIQITRIIDGSCRGSSRPVIAETPAGEYLVKLRGAAQGSGALVSEIIVSELAEALHLPVLPKCMAVLDSDTPTEDKNDELADLLSASEGLNLAFPLLNNARVATRKDLLKLTVGEKAAILWLDRLTMNPDRINRNPNILFSADKLYLIDHGACLRFQYNWSNITEETPSYIGTMFEPHIFEMISESPSWEHWESLFAQCITRSVLEKALAAVPNSFIYPLLPKTICGEPFEKQEIGVQRRKAAYVAFLWKRLKPPRDFALQSPIYQRKKISKIQHRGLTFVST